MSSSTTFSPPAGCISIPVEIVSSSTSNPTRRPTSSFRPYHHDNRFNEVSHSPPSKKPSTTSYSTGRFQPRHSPVASYERLIQNSHFNQPFYDRPLFQDPPFHSFHSPIYERRTLQPSRSSDDLLFSPADTRHPNGGSRNSNYFPEPFHSGFRPDSDFVEFNKHMDAVRRSHDALHDFPDAHQTFPTNRSYPFEQPKPDYRASFVNPHEDRVLHDHQQPLHNTYDRSHSPASPRDESPARPAPATSHQQHSKPEPESDFKMTRETGNSMPRVNTTTATSAQSTDQQVPSADVAPVRDPNVIALEKLEQIKQHLTDLSERVETFSGSTRDDRSYKLLDEQALKMMMRCDELVDVSADVKEKRKEMIRNVQSVVAKLESKVPINPTVESSSSSSTQMETSLIALEPTESPEENPSA